MVRIVLTSIFAPRKKDVSHELYAVSFDLAVLAKRSKTSKLKKHVKKNYRTVR